MNRHIHSSLQRLKRDLNARYGVTRIGYFTIYLDEHKSRTPDLNILVELEKPLGWDFFALKEFLERKLEMHIDICTPNALKPALKNEIISKTHFV